MQITNQNELIRELQQGITAIDHAEREILRT